MPVPDVSAAPQYLRKEMFGNAASEAQRFAAAVERLIHHKEPVYLQLGFGRHPLRDFLNLDIRYRVLENTVPADFQPSCFIFPWLSEPLPVAGGCIDFIFHEDMFEHLSQREQYMLLAEGLRILKRGRFHRINCPNLEDVLRRNSDFLRGMEGVYDEWSKWHHHCVPTRQGLEEQALIAGYSSIHFNHKNGTISGVKFNERRPGGDRDPLTGNLHADLEK
jgi:hypothetical protein